MAIRKFTCFLSLLSALIIPGCGGKIVHLDPASVRLPVDDPTPPLATPTPAPPPINPYLNASMIGQVWIFQNAAQTCTTTIHVNAPPLSNYYPAGSIVLNITKSGADCYWTPGTENASIDFVLSPMPDGSYNSLGWVAYFPTVLPSWSPYHTYASEVQAPAGSPTPYMIVPPPSLDANSTLIYETSYNRWDYNGQNFNSFVSGSPVANVYWKTVFYMLNGQAISDQREGICGHEKWTFAANRGLVSIEFPNDGDVTCVTNLQFTTIFRVN
jgi:hypothetical protein